MRGKGALMAKSYVKFEVSNEVVSRTYEALQLVKQSGKIRKGANEVTKSVEQGLASFVVIAGDVEPEEVVIHIPKICEEKKIPYSYVPSKLDLGKSIGLTVPCTAVAVENAGSADHNIRDVVSKVTGQSQQIAQPQAQEQKKDAKPKEKREKRGEEKEKKHAPAPEAGAAAKQ